MRVHVILFIHPTDEILLPPAPQTESRSELFMYKEKYFRIIENKGDGLCLFYSVLHFVNKHTNSTDGYTLQKDWELLREITNFETLTDSGIIEHMARFVGDLSDEEFKIISEIFVYDQDITFERNIEPYLPKSEINRLGFLWVKNLLGEVIHATKTKTGAWPNEFQVYILSKMLQLRIVIIQSSWDEGLIQMFNTDDSSFIFHRSELKHSSSYNFSKAPTGNKTCYLLQFDEAIQATSESLSPNLN